MKRYILDDNNDESMSKTEVRSISIKVLDLRDGEDVVSANALHTPPHDGSALTIIPTVEEREGSWYVDLALGPFGFDGWHFVKVQAVGDGDPASKPEVLYAIEVKDV